MEYTLLSSNFEKLLMQRDFIHADWQTITTDKYEPGYNPLL